MRLAFVINSLRLGGAQRALINIAEAFDKHEHSVSLVTLYHQQTDFFALAESVNRVALGVEGETRGLLDKLFRNARRVVALRGALLDAHPDVVISFLPETNILVLLAGVGAKTPTVVVEQTIPARQEIPRVWQWLRRATYPLSAKLVCASRGISDSFMWLPDQHKKVIYNSFAAPQSVVLPQPEQYARPKRRHLISMGRLHQVKGFDLLVEAFARISARYSDWDLTIWGEGVERFRLESQIKQFGLQDRIFLPGVTSDPLGVMKAAHLFVLSSRFEGFGNVLIEAMVCGLPVISFDCPSGPREIIQHEVTGILVPPEDVEALSEAIAHSIQNKHQRELLAVEARNASEKFGIGSVFPEWEELVKQLKSA